MTPAPSASPDQRAVHAPRGLPRRWLLALGWGLAALLPLAAAVLILAEYSQFTTQRDARLQLVADAVERQLADRLYLLDLQLALVATGRSAQRGFVIPMQDVRVTPAGDDAPRTLSIGPPEKVDGTWRVPVARQYGARVANAWVDTSLFTGVVRGLSMGPSDFISLVHRDGTLVARSVDHERNVGRKLAGSGLYAPENRGRREGAYDERSVVDGIDRSYGFRRLDKVPLTILVGVEKAPLMAAWVRLAATILVIATALAIAWGWLVRLFDRAQRRQNGLIAQLRTTLGALQASEESLRKAHALARLGEYEWLPGSAMVRYSDEGARIYGFDGAGHVALADVFDRIHPEDRARVRAVCEAAPDSDECVDLVYRVTRPDGAELHVHARGEVQRDEAGRRIVRGVVQDVTEITRERERAERAERQYRFLFAHNPLPMWVYDLATLDILAVNEAMVQRYGYEAGELVGRSAASIRPAEDVAKLHAAAATPAEELPQGRIWTHLHRNGRAMRMQVHSHDITFDGRRARLVAGQDVTEREQAEERFRMVARATSDAIYDYDIEAGSLWWSESYFTRFGYERSSRDDELPDWAMRIHPDDRERVAASLDAALAGSDAEWQENYRYRRGDGTYASVMDRGFVLRDATGRAVRLVGGMLDVSDRQHYEDQLAWRATHDELTGLPNRQLLQDRLQTALAVSQRHGREGTLVFIDLDDFKLVNDSLGHSAGDRVLREVGQRLSDVVRDTDTVARFGGDEFVVVLTETHADHDVQEFIHRLVAALARPLDIGDSQHTLTASIGWCRFPEAGRDVETLLMHGDLAMYQAKRQGRNRAVPFHPDFVAGISRRLQMVGQLRQAIERDEFVPVFQPLFDRDERPVALETLLRWQHPERGMLLPGEFIATCEESGLIVDVGRQVLRQAARHHGLLAAAGLGTMRIAVNVSPAQFNDSLVQYVRDALAEFRVPAEALELEITEGLLMANPERAIELMRQIAALGVTFSVDDFGTGYSSLAYLKRFPIDRLKIDRSFVRDLGVDEEDAAICNSIIGLAHALDIRTVAEGVETSLQLDWLRTRRIDEVQGYLLGRPMPFEQLLPILLERAARPVPA